MPEFVWLIRSGSDGLPEVVRRLRTAGIDPKIAFATELKAVSRACALIAAAKSDFMALCDARYRDMRDREHQLSLEKIATLKGN